MKHSRQDEKYINRCIRLAKESLSSGDNPFGCVITGRDGMLIEAKNEINADDVTSHAEIVALTKAQKLLSASDFSKCTLYSICEPCPMCAFMIRELKVARVVFALCSPHMGGYSKWNILQDQALARFKPVFSDPPEVISGVLEREARELFEEAGWTIHRK